jgi:hypothetical protein
MKKRFSVFAIITLTVFVSFFIWDYTTFKSGTVTTTNLDTWETTTVTKDSIDKSFKEEWKSK